MPIIRNPNSDNWVIGAIDYRDMFNATPSVPSIQALGQGQASVPDYLRGITIAAPCFVLIPLPAGNKTNPEALKKYKSPKEFRVVKNKRAQSLKPGDCKCVSCKNGSPIDMVECAICDGPICAHQVNQLPRGFKSNSSRCIDWADTDEATNITSYRCAPCNTRYRLCYGCKELTNKSFFSQYGNKDYCPSCAHELKAKCLYCEQTKRFKLFAAMTLVVDVQIEFNGLCDCCYQSGAWLCHCGKPISAEHINSCDCSRHFCNECFSRHRCSQKKLKLCQHSAALIKDGAYAIGSHGTKPYWDKLHHKFDHEHDPYIGVELEIECNTDRPKGDKLSSIDKCARFIGEILPGKALITYDSSIQHGFEIGFIPTKRHALPELRLREVCRGLIERGATSHKMGTCGLHIHITRTPWLREKFMAGACNYTNADLFQMLFIYMQKDITKLSLRGAGAIGRYCQFARSGDMLVNGDSHRYCAINLSPRETVEVRIWRGTLNIHRMMACIEFSLAALDFLRANSRALILGAMPIRAWYRADSRYVGGQTAQMLRVQHAFSSWLVKQQRYDFLVRFLAKHGLFNLAKRHAAMTCEDSEETETATAKFQRSPVAWATIQNNVSELTF